LKRLGEVRNSYKGLFGKPEGERPLGKPMRRDEKIILEWILGKYAGKVWAGCMWLRIRNSDGIM
jgi:hypothetical protein